MERELADLSLDDEEDKILQAQTNPDSVPVEIYLFLVGCFMTANVIHFSAMRSIMTDMEHDSEKSVIERGDGKKRPRSEGDKSVNGEELGSLLVRSRRVLGSNHITSAAAKGQPDLSQ
ncbi:hypothetical protein Goshw_023901 [Gossypium schwendimanii]|uniref:Uncharacterized protein n=1 Tax=Gossypium schwendimanii TaxID=34291 RepID=A0A7J9MJZ6_GOSSC|nr:hypothetical protein [Gossypium schwendimanii]